jgi:hypothetical protein
MNSRAMSPEPDRSLPVRWVRKSAEHLDKGPLGEMTALSSARGLPVKCRGRFENWPSSLMRAGASEHRSLISGLL